MELSALIFFTSRVLNAPVPTLEYKNIRQRTKSGIPGCFIGLYPFFLNLFFHASFFYESQALHKQLCSGICYFLVTLLVLHMLFFGVFASNYALF